MISIKKGNKFLDLIEGTTIERERVSPFFSKDEIPGEVSLPFTLPASPNNMQQLGNLDILPVKKDAQFDVIIYDEGLQVTHGKLATEFVETTIDNASRGKISVFALSNASEYYQRIKDKKLSDLDLGGDRIFNWDGYNTNVGSTGFWRHIHNTWETPYNEYPDYSFYPISNPGFLGGSKGWMNMMKYYDNEIQFAREENINCLCPSINLLYLLKKAFTDFGYLLKGDILNDIDFKSLSIPSFYSVLWCNSNHTYSPGGIIDVYQIIPQDTITINLQQHVPTDYPIATFLVEMQKLLPLGFDIDDNARTCELVLLSEINASGAKDKTGEISTEVKIDFDKEEKLFALHRDFDGGDSLVGMPDFSKERIAVSPADTIDDIPSIYSVNTVVFIIKLNAWYKQLVFDQTLTWSFFADNIYNYDPVDYTDSISCKITPMMVSEQQMATGIHGFFPSCKQEGNWNGKRGATAPWQLRVLFYRGKLQYKNTGQAIPLAYNHIYHTNQYNQKIGNWSLSYTADGYGVYDLFFSKWLKTFGNREKLSCTWSPRLHEYLGFRWRFPFLVQNTPYMIEKIKEKLPYNGSVEIEARRMN